MNAFAIQMKLGSDPGAYPLPLTEFPFSFTLQEYVDWYWKVKTYTMTADVSVSYKLDGISYSFVKSYSGTLYRQGLDPLGIDTSEGNIFSDEAGGVQDSILRDDETASQLSCYYFWDEAGLLAHFDRGFSAFHFGFDLIEGYSQPRGYWTGSNGGASGNVIPRFNAQIDWYFPKEETTPEGFGQTIFQLLTNRASEYSPNGVIAGGFVFCGKSSDIAWGLNVVPDPFGVDTEPQEVIVDASLSIEPLEYFEFSDGVTPLWNSATGVQLVDPLPH